MANYNIVIGSKFRPFSYAEMLAPVAQSTEAHQKVEEGYANLSAQADMIAGLAAMEPNSEAARRYKAYSDSLYEKADRLARNGLTPQDRSDMLSMYSRYAKEIKPIETAIKMREADITRQDTLYDKGNGKIRFDRDARDVSIDEYLDGKRPKYTSLNLDSIRQEVAANTQAWSKRYFSTEEGQRFNGDYYKLTQLQGIPADEARNILLGNLDKYPELQKLIASEKGIVNYSGFSKNTQAEVDNAIAQGLNIGMFFDRKETTAENWQKKLAVQNQYAKDLETYKKQLAGEGDGIAGEGDAYRIVSNVEANDADIASLKKDLQWLEDIEKRGGFDSRKVTKTQQGVVAVSDQTNIKTPPPLYGAKSRTNDDAIYANNYSRLTRKYGLGNGNTYDANTLSKLKAMVQKEINNNITKKSTYKINITDSSDIAQVILENTQTSSRHGDSKNLGVTEYKTGKPVSRDEIAKIRKDGKDFSFDYEPDKGFILNYTLDGKDKEVVVNPDLLGYNGRYTNGASTITNLINSGNTQEAIGQIDGMLNDLYYMFETRRVKQSNSGEVK